MRSVRAKRRHCQLPRYLQHMHQALTCNHPLRLPMLRILSRLLPVGFMLPDAQSSCGLLPPLSCLPCTAAVDAVQRAALCAGHCVHSAIIAANDHAASVRKSRLRCFRRLPCCLPAAAALTRTSRRSILEQLALHNSSHVSQSGTAPPLSTATLPAAHASSPHVQSPASAALAPHSQPFASGLPLSSIRNVLLLYPASFPCHRNSSAAGM